MAARGTVRLAELCTSADFREVDKAHLSHVLRQLVHAGCATRDAVRHNCVFFELTADGYALARIARQWDGDARRESVILRARLRDKRIRKTNKRSPVFEDVAGLQRRM